MKSLYESDYARWAEVMAQRLQEKRFAELDLNNLVEEIQDLSKRERDSLLSSVRLINGTINRKSDRAVGKLSLKGKEKIWHCIWKIVLV